ncbi:putative aldo-keto reductase [Plasmodium gaboni]|uniref:Putative aldo-keto reductase n=1 Tax=Plasmodium gaboni TaxID=647221 RepID=A0A151L9S5_9APIC|nr:putative aldo-keto reductase [Plasmodium gaboni]KYN95702.1 putative aldo-keto reductase [Plasmodium gaboni]
MKYKNRLFVILFITFYSTYICNILCVLLKEPSYYNVTHVPNFKSIKNFKNIYKKYNINNELNLSIYKNKNKTKKRKSSFYFITNNYILHFTPTRYNKNIIKYKDFSTPNSKKDYQIYNLNKNKQKLYSNDREKEQDKKKSTSKNKTKTRKTQQNKDDKSLISTEKETSKSKSTLRKNKNNSKEVNLTIQEKNEENKEIKEAQIKNKRTYKKKKTESIQNSDKIEDTDKNKNTAKSEETAKNKKTAKSEETAKNKKIAKSEETAKNKKTVKSKETAKNKKTAKSEETYNEKKKPTLRKKINESEETLNLHHPINTNIEDQNGKATTDEKNKKIKEQEIELAELIKHERDYGDEDDEEENLEQYYDDLQNDNDTQDVSASKKEEEEEKRKQMKSIQEEKEKLERQKKIDFIKKVEHLLEEDEKNHVLYEKRPDIDKLKFGDKPPPGSEDLINTILKNVNEDNNKNQIDKIEEMNKLKKKHLFYELYRISNSSSFKAHKIYTHPDLIYGMKYRKLGESNLCVSELCIGTNMYENDNFISKDDVNVLLNMAFYEYGINFFDICEYDPFPFDPDSYRKSKNRNMNLFLKDKKRENVIINLRMCSSRNVNKLEYGDYYLSWIMEGLKDDTPTFYNIEERLDKILKNLNTNYVDILTIDIPERYIPNNQKGEDTYIWGYENLNAEQNKNSISIEEQFDILEKLILKGKVRHIAVSNESVWGIYQWCNLAKKKKKNYMKIVCVQNLYNLLHKNEVESSGLVEMILKENYNVPLVPYGLLAGGILTGKYLDPERYHTMGPEKVLGDDQLDHDLNEARGNIPEDYGYLSYGPKNGRCNKYPHLYKSHRCVWAQDATGEYLKLARSHGMSLSQLSLSYVYSRPFVGSSIIGPRTLGQLKDSIFALNYPMYQHTEWDIHEIFLRYRGCTMDGNTILNSLDDPNKTSQNVFYKTANIPILSGGTYWKNYPLPHIMKRYEYTDLKEEQDRIKSTFGLNDEPNDANFISSRMWVEREKRKGEYFAVKESNIFKWNKFKIYKGAYTKLSEKEKQVYDTSDFHFTFKNNTISVTPTDEEIKNFYDNEKKIKKIITQNINDHQELFQYKEELGQDLPAPFNNLDIDLIYKQLLNRHNINPLDKKELDSIYEYIKLTPSELETEDFWYIYKYNPFDTSFAFRTGTEP